MAEISTSSSSAAPTATTTTLPTPPNQTHQPIPPQLASSSSKTSVQSKKRKPECSGAGATAASHSTQRKRKRSQLTKKQRSIENAPKDENIHYFFFRGQRHVRPYDFVYSTFAKKRWYGREILEVYSSEFVRYTRDYYVKAIASGRVTVNDNVVSTKYCVQNGDLLKHYVHRHEPPVDGTRLTPVHETKDVIVVNKPGSIPVHPTGRFRYNSVLEILKRQENIDAQLIHRLDRVTSGLLVLAKSQEVAVRLSAQIRDHRFVKTYVARVLGKFPEEVLVDQPIGYKERKNMTMCVDPKGKPCKTKFKRLSFNGHSSVVECQPITGRTHQIRVHLQWLGYPIANDPAYGGCLFASNSVACKGPTWTEEEKKEFELLKVKEDFKVPLCAECQSKSYWEDSGVYCTFIWLHSWRYTGPEWSFEVPLPSWAGEAYDSRVACANKVRAERGAT